MNVALIGGYGQLGTDLQATLPGQVEILGHGQIEVTDPASVGSVLTEVRYDVVVNCAAYNLVDQAEDEPAVAYLVNGLGARNVARVCAAQGSRLVHVSTDYVFGLDRQRNEPYRVDDPPGPLSAYGTSKLAGEFYVRSLHPDSLVVRTCGLYGHVGVRGKGNFVETMLRLGGELPQLKVVNDQRCTPSSTADVARAISELVSRDATPGVYHATNSGSTTWFELARTIFELAGLNVETLPISTAEFGAKAGRPHYSVLDNSRLVDVTGHEPPDWRDALRRYLEDRPE